MIIKNFFYLKFYCLIFKYIEPVSGKFVDSNTGTVIHGVTHSGIHNFTLGKRIRNTFLYSNCEGLFVSGLDFKTQTVYFVSNFYFFLYLFYFF